jgi:hypothetical protein
LNYIRPALARSAVSAGSAAERAPLVLDTKIPIGDVRGRIDHLAIDVAHRRLFVAELGNETVSFDRFFGETPHSRDPRSIEPDKNVSRLGSRIEFFRNAFASYGSLLRRRGIPSDSFSDSYGDFRGTVGIGLLSDSASC